MIDTVILGIGNVGTKYNGTRHNIGFDTIDAIANSVEKLDTIKFKYSYAATTNIGKNSILLIKPNTYVNLSGIAAKEVLEFYNLESSNLLVLVDDFHLPLGTIRYRRKGSAGGHNGLKSLIEECGDDFHRLRIGIGPVPEEISIVDFVLGHFNDKDLALKDEVVNSASQSIPFYLENGLDKSMNRFNSQKTIIDKPTNI